MSDVFHLLKLYGRRRNYKLLREGISFLLEHYKEVPDRIFQMPRDGPGSLLLCPNVAFTLYLTSDGYIKREFKVAHQPQVEFVPFQECKFENLETWDVQRAADTIGDRLYLFIPKEQVTISMIIHCRNSAIQSRLINTYGEKEFFAKLNAAVVHRDGDSELLRIRVGRAIEMMMVKVKDSTTGQTYLLRVPTEIVTYTRTDIVTNDRTHHQRTVQSIATIPMTTCKQAIAWTFGMRKEEYRPEKET